MLQDKVQEALAQLKSKGYEAVGCAANVGKLEDIQRLVRLATSTFGRIDVLVSNAGINPATGGILDLEDWAIDKMLAVNIKSAIQLIREAKPHMAKARLSSCGAQCHALPSSRSRVRAFTRFAIVMHVSSHSTFPERQT